MAVEIDLSSKARAMLDELVERWTAEHRLFAENLRICRRAGLPEKRWHTLRHSFGTHAALFGMNPWRLQSWMATRGSTRR